MPFRDETFDAVVALYMLYHLPTPQNTVAEAHRVLRPGGLFVACAPSRHNDPELAAVCLQSSELYRRDFSLRSK